MVDDDAREYKSLTSETRHGTPPINRREIEADLQRITQKMTRIQRI